MRRIILWSIASTCLCSLTIFAEPGMPSFGPEKVAVQSLKQAGQPPVQQPQVPQAQPTQSPSANSAAEEQSNPVEAAVEPDSESAMAKVQEIMQSAKRKAQDIDSKQPISHPVAPSLSNGKQQELEIQLNQLSQSYLVSQQQLTQKIQELNNKNKYLDEKIQKLHQVLVLLNQQVSQINHTSPSIQPQQPSESSSSLAFILENSNLIIMALILLLIGISLYFFWQHWENKSQNKSKPSEPVQKVSAKSEDEEYDFMGSPEAEPSKLDLARAYLAMGDYDAADKVLEELLTRRGN